MRKHQKSSSTELRWSSGYDARLTRERSPVQARDEVFFEEWNENMLVRLWLQFWFPSGPVAQWIRHRSTEPEIVGSSPTRVILFSKTNRFALIYEHLSAFAYILSPCGVMDNALDF